MNPCIGYSEFTLKTIESVGDQMPVPGVNRIESECIKEDEKQTKTPSANTKIMKITKAKKGRKKIVRKKAIRSMLKEVIVKRREVREKKRVIKSKYKEEFKSKSRISGNFKNTPENHLVTIANNTKDSFIPMLKLRSIGCLPIIEKPIFRYIKM